MASIKKTIISHPIVYQISLVIKMGRMYHSNGNVIHEVINHVNKIFFVVIESLVNSFIIIQSNELSIKIVNSKDDRNR
jgi:hypothetical protein